MTLTYVALLAPHPSTPVPDEVANGGDGDASFGLSGSEGQYTWPGPASAPDDGLTSDIRNRISIH